MPDYDDHGIRFRYPDDWQIEEERIGQEVYVNLTGDGTSFWSLTLFEDRPEPMLVLESALEAFRDEYDELDVYETGVPEVFDDEEAVARDLEFVCLELVSSAFLRVFRAEAFTGLVLYQGEDRELDETRETLEAITRSLDW